MKEYTSEFIRNIAFVSHSGAGKTMLCEAFLHATGATTRLGKVEDGTTAADFEDEEIRRKLSLSTAATDETKSSAYVPVLNSVYKRIFAVVSVNGVVDLL